MAVTDLRGNGSFPSGRQQTARAVQAGAAATRRDQRARGRHAQAADRHHVGAAEHVDRATGLRAEAQLRADLPPLLVGMEDFIRRITQTTHQIRPGRPSTAGAAVSEPTYYYYY